MQLLTSLIKKIGKLTSFYSSRPLLCIIITMIMSAISWVGQDIVGFIPLLGSKAGSFSLLLFEEANNNIVQLIFLSTGIE